MIKTSRKIPLWFTVGSILEKLRMRLRLKVHIRTVLRLDSSLSYTAIVYQTQILVVGNHMASKNSGFLLFYYVSFRCTALSFDICMHNKMSTQI